MASLPDFKILAKGYEIVGDVRSGFTITVPYYIAWGDVIQMLDAVLPAPVTNPGGGVTWIPPLQFPITINGITRPTYAQSFTCIPVGLGDAYPGDMPFNGLNPGEFYRNAIFTVVFSSVLATQQDSDDPSGYNQLDPLNPITMCEQSIEVNGKVIATRGAGWTYAAGTGGTWAGKSVPGDVPIVSNEARLVCRFPRVPFLPWQVVQPYIGKINIVTILNCAPGSLLLEGFRTVLAPQPGGGLAQNAALIFSWNPDPTGNNPTGMSWNKFVTPDQQFYGILEDAGGSGRRPYKEIDFTIMFMGLTFQRGS